MLRLDKNRKVFVASLQGRTASRLLSDEVSEDMKTFVLYENSELFYKSGAVFRLAAILKGPLVLLLAFCWLPRGLTDWVYDFVAKNRYRFMGRRQTCRTPGEREKQHFLD